ncbi:hypothetical protein C4D60_Mb04t14770 [Musa balbisiana]|uniref:Uncharacterized protein n=1 Tax=Musa balbisiana TaxID=52838 RepID=A0A4S8KC36_MUSBA|nr:hypothetical protein C4D60_Mb04t14770 [Musa balbisiana]
MRRDGQATAVATQGEATMLAQLGQCHQRVEHQGGKATGRGVVATVVTGRNATVAVGLAESRGGRGPFRPDGLQREEDVVVVGTTQRGEVASWGTTAVVVERPRSSGGGGEGGVGDVTQGGSAAGRRAAVVARWLAAVWPGSSGGGKGNRCLRQQRDRPLLYFYRTTETTMSIDRVAKATTKGM